MKSGRKYSMLMEYLFLLVVLKQQKSSMAVILVLAPHLREMDNVISMQRGETPAQFCCSSLQQVYIHPEYHY